MIGYFTSKYRHAIKSAVLLPLLLISWLFSSVAAAEILRVAVASNFKEVAISLAQKFTAENKVKIEVVSGSTGKLFVQIRQGAPFDVFLSADKKTIEKMLIDKLAVEYSDKAYAIGQLVLWSKSCQQGLSLNNFDMDEKAKIAIANPRLAPYGAAAKEFLQNGNLWHRLGPRFVYAENISQVAQLAKLGVVDAAFISESQRATLQASQTGCFVKLPVAGYSPIEQWLVIVKTTNHSEKAQSFVNFLSSKQAQNLIKNRGYLLPDSVKIAPL